MSGTDKARPEERVRWIEEETEYLEHDLAKAREAVQQARRADTLASPGHEQASAEAAPKLEEETGDQA